MRRVVLVLTDGLRPEAVTSSGMPSLRALASAYAYTPRATTVRPSTTVAALTSLATGVAPRSHGLIEPGLGFPPRLATLRPVARELARAGYASEIVANALGPVERGVLRALSAAAGVARVTSDGARAWEVAATALHAAQRRTGGILFVYLNDCDRAGHAHGWMSDQYLEAAAEVDRAIGLLTHLVEHDLVVVLADHGGGGVTPTDHDAPHPTNDRIPLVLAGPDVARAPLLTQPVSLLDVPPTLCHWLGVDVPAEYEGRVLHEAFSPVSEPTGVAA